MSQSNATIVYLKMSLKTILKNFSVTAITSCIRYYPQWKHYLQPGKSSVSEKLPWLSFAAIDRIRQIVQPGTTVFEYGSGGSTLFWSSHVKRVVSMEHQPEWYQLIKEELKKQQIDNVDYFFADAEPDPDFDRKRVENPDDYISNAADFVGFKFEKYVQKIDEYPDEYFDIVLVDGRARPSCMVHSLKKVKVNGYIILDNSERSYYLQRLQLDKQVWQRKDYPGPVPFMRHFSTTTFFRKMKSYK